MCLPDSSINEFLNYFGARNFEKNKGIYSRIGSTKDMRGEPRNSYLNPKGLVSPVSGM